MAVRTSSAALKRSRPRVDIRLVVADLLEALLGVLIAGNEGRREWSPRSLLPIAVAIGVGCAIGIACAFLFGFGEAFPWLLLVAAIIAGLMAAVVLALVGADTGSAIAGAFGAAFVEFFVFVTLRLLMGLDSLFEPWL